jgi:hypothetical protein
MQPQVSKITLASEVGLLLAAFVGENLIQDVRFGQDSAAAKILLLLEHQPGNLVVHQ